MDPDERRFCELEPSRQPALLDAIDGGAASRRTVLYREQHVRAHRGDGSPHFVSAALGILRS